MRRWTKHQVGWGRDRAHLRRGPSSGPRGRYEWQALLWTRGTTIFGSLCARRINRQIAFTAGEVPSLQGPSELQLPQRPKRGHRHGGDPRGARVRRETAGSMTQTSIQWLSSGEPGVPRGPPDPWAGDPRAALSANFAANRTR